MAADGKRATEPEQVTRLIAERLNAGDVDGIAELYETDAVLAYPPDDPTSGVESIKAIYRAMAEQNVRFATDEEQLPTVRFEDLALASTTAADGTGMRVQVLRKQSDGTWKRIIDRPEVR
ncbi:YybH family protein [Glycomyces tenuis]|uniref:YybH family protein n=1 Tax=Glycomyces tenuis TaxID=58116 RepID=UPI0003F70899|nr:nuclear transport factor 2 family protein [Glycomyces tenuis]